MDKISKDKQKKNLIKRVCVFAVTCAFLLCSLFFENSINCILNNTSLYLKDDFKNSSLQVHFIDVGQGDCTFIKANDKSIIIDAGTQESGKHIINYLKNLGYTKNSTIDYLILTHTDSDHIGGACQLLDEYKFKNIYIPKMYSTFEIENNLIEEDYNISYSKLWKETSKKIYNEVDKSHKYYNFAGESISEKDFKINFYSPTLDQYDNSNDYSPIMILESGNFKFAFVGDASEEVEEQFLLNYEQEILDNIFDCDVLKVAHHGSSSSTTEEFLSALSPEVAVISCSKDNSYNHPSDEVVNRLTNANCKILRTDTMDSIVIYENEDTLSINSGFMDMGGIYIEWKYILISIIIILCCVVVFNKKLI